MNNKNKSTKNESEKSNNKDKIIKISHTCKIVSKVLYVIDCITTLAFLVLAIVLPLTNAIKSITPAECAIIFSVLTFYGFFALDFLWNTTKFFETICNEQSIFSYKVTRYIKRLAISSLILSTIPAIIGSIFIHLLAPESEFVFRLEIVGIMASVVLFFISLFFKYGSELQKQDDETLWSNWT